MSEKSEQYVEQLLEAIKIIAQSEAQLNSQYDKTEICTIVDASESEKGKYWVTQNDNVKYEAYCDPSEAKYREKDSVRVAILKGDYTSKKYIIGKEAKSQDKINNYISPLGDVLFPENAAWITINPEEQHLVINGSTKEILLGSLDVEGKYNIRDVYNILGIKTEFRLKAQDKKIIKGNYGLRIEFSTSNFGTIETRLDSLNMLGNIYNFAFYSSQLAKFDIKPEWGNLSKIDIYLYQDQNFEYITEDKKIELVPNDIYKIECRNIEINYGSDITTIQNNKVKLLPIGNNSNNSDYYIYSDNELRQVALQWYNKSEDGEYIGYSDGRVVLAADDNATLGENGKVIYHFDEITYQATLEEENKLLQARSDKRPSNLLGLKIAYFYDVAIEQSNLIIKSITDLMKIVKKYKYFSNLSGLNDSLQQLIDNSVWPDEHKYNLKQIRTTFEKNLIEFKTIMDFNLEQALSIQNNLKHEAMKDPTELNDILGQIKLELEKWLSFVDGTFNMAVSSSQVTSDDNALFKSLRADLIFNINNIIPFYFDKNMIEKLLTFEQISQEEKLPFVSSLNNAEFVNKMANFYSIYWYQKDENAQGDLISGPGWIRLEHLDNKVLPDTYGSNNFLNTYSENTTVDLVLNGGNNTPQQSVFKAVIIYNHECFWSNELVFINLYNVSGVDKLINKGTLQIEHGANSKIKYFYNTHGQITNLLERNKKRTLFASFSGDNISNEALIGTTIYWHIPEISTMLRIPSDLGSLGLKLLDAGEQKKPGYITYYRDIKYFDEHFMEASNEIQYLIATNYNRLAQNNTIICEIYKHNEKLYEDFIDFSFITTGINGSPYSLIIKPYNANKIACMNETRAQGGYSLLVQLFNEKNEQIPMELNNLDISFILNHEAFEEFNSELDKQVVEDGIKITIYSRPDNSRNGYSILKIDYIVQKNQTQFINLSTLYSIAYRSNSNCYIEGIDQIWYDASGKLLLEEENTVPFKLYNINGQPIEDNVEWSIDYVNYLGNTLLKTDQGYLPKLNENNVLIPCNLYIYVNSTKSDEFCFPVVKALYKQTIIWQQPILIQQDKFGSQFLNDWDGKLQIDEKGNTIMSTMVGAGIKNSDNSFSGVLMGQVSNTIGITPPSLTTSHSGIGLYGIHNGEFSYGFNIEGTAFLGKATGGRIWFDGNNGFIASQNWFAGGGKIVYNTQGDATIIPSSNGMLIDLQSGYINAYNFKLDSAGIQIQSMPDGQDNDYYLRVWGRTNIINDNEQEVESDLMKLFGIEKLTSDSKHYSVIASEMHFEAPQQYNGNPRKDKVIIKVSTLLGGSLNSNILKIEHTTSNNKTSVLRIFRRHDVGLRIIGGNLAAYSMTSGDYGISFDTQTFCIHYGPKVKLIPVINGTQVTWKIQQ